MRWTVIGLGGALAGALALAGCSSGESGGNTSDTGGGALAGGGGAQPQLAPSNLADDPQNGVEPVTLPSPTPVTSIPAAFRGRWGMVVTDCEPGRADAKGLMVVTGSGLRFANSRATAASLATIGSTTLIAQLAYSGGGQDARRADRLTLVDDGKTLVRQEQNAPAAFRYLRCPA